MRMKPVLPLLIEFRVEESNYSSFLSYVIPGLMY